MKTIFLHDKKAIESFFRKALFLNIYSIGDLDDFFWKYTNWFAIKENSEIKAIALLYKAPDFPVLLAISEEDDLYMKNLLNSVKYFLPKRFYCHLTLGLKQILNIVASYHEYMATLNSL